MSVRNLEYDFKWCPGCGDFGVRRALGLAIGDRTARLETSMANNLVVAGIGCSGNMVHLLEGPQPFGFHGIHGRSLPIAFGAKMARPDLNVIVVAGDGDFLGIGMEHIGPQAARNLDVCAIVIDNGVYGLTKGQASPTTQIGVVTVSSPYGKLEQAVSPLELYLAVGVSFIASGFSSKPKDLALLIGAAMDHPGFAIVHVQSPCTTYNDTYEALKGNFQKGIEPLVYEVPEDHDPTDRIAAFGLVHSPGIPLGVIYRDEVRPSLTKSFGELQERARPRTAQELLDAYEF